MVDFNASLLAPLYATLGVPATLVLVGGSSSDSFDLTVIDKTAGVTIGDHVEVPTLKPAAAIRRAELASLGLNKDDIVDGILNFNGFSWKIVNLKPDSNPSGELKGQVLAYLENQTELNPSG